DAEYLDGIPGEIFIAVTNDGRNDAKPLGPGDAPLGVDITYDPDRDGNRYPFSDGTPYDPCSILVHEMSHARRLLDGNRFPVRINEEVEATKVENEFRKARGLDIRDCYGLEPVPDEPPQR